LPWGVECTQCLQDIVGPRFHCVVCISVDVCSDCESAGLHGDLDSSDGGHDSSHVMVKIPYPVKPSDVQGVSDQAMARWNGGEPIGRTVSSGGGESMGGLNHGMRCDWCYEVIIGTRYQCGNCPSTPHSYNLCQSCDDESYRVHDPTHIFFKIRRPVDRLIESPEPILPILYRYRVAIVGHVDAHDPKAYLRKVIHDNIFCDLCMDRIIGEWFHCVYCPRDLCGHCEEVDEHDTTHFSMVAKAPVNMAKFYHFTEMSAEEASGPPIMKYPVYSS